jgi:hypothetical protein
MFEDFRKLIDETAFSDDDQEELPDEVLPEEPRLILGLNPIQRFFVAFMLLVMTIVVGVLVLLVTSRIALPFIG